MTTAAAAATTTRAEAPATMTRVNPVADYYAVLGVVDELTWKHAQKKHPSQQQPDGNNDNTTTTPATSTSTVQREDEEERFWREIVQVSIILEHDDGKDNHQAVSSSCPEDEPTPLASATVADNCSNNRDSLLRTVLSDRSEDESSAASQLSTISSFFNQHHNHGSQQQQLQQSSLRFGMTDTTTLASAGGAMPPLTKSQDGHCVVRTTLPTAVPIFDGAPSSLLDGPPKIPPHWNSINHSHHKRSVVLWDANLDWLTGLRAEIWEGQQQQQQQRVEQQHRQAAGNNSEAQPTSTSSQFKGLLRRKVETKFKQFQQQLYHTNKPHESFQSGGNDTIRNKSIHGRTKFYLSYQRRQKEIHWDTPGIASVQLAYIRLHRNTIVVHDDFSQQPNDEDSLLTTTTTDVRLGYPHQPQHQRSKFSTSEGPVDNDDDHECGRGRLVLLEDYLPSLGKDFDEWSIPASHQWIRDPATATPIATPGHLLVVAAAVAHKNNNNNSTAEYDHGVEVIETNSNCNTKSAAALAVDPTLMLPKLVSSGKDVLDDDNDQPIFCYVPVLALRRQRLGDEERYHEDPALTDIAVTFSNEHGQPMYPEEGTAADEDDDEEEDVGTFRVLGKTAWSSSPVVLPPSNATVALAGLSSLGYRMEEAPSPTSSSSLLRRNKLLGIPMLLVRKNLPFGFADAAFATRVLGRFPFRNYKGLPLPEEELPMFCYPTGCRLHRSQFGDAPLPQYYGFVVKNERGDSIYVSCVSFMEPLTAEKSNQLTQISNQRRRTSLPHRRFCERREQQQRRKASADQQQDKKLATDYSSNSSEVSTEADSNFLLTAFDDMTTFENKTICLVSRYPFWSAFRKFLSHLHIISESCSDLPLERYISHLLLSVPLPRPGGPSVLVPLPALNEPMILTMPPEKDFPLLDLPYHRLFACLDIRSIVIIVLGLLALERKVIVMSTRPSLVLDVCELLRSLLFPFELCAPYVPRLTEPFKSSLDFPGAIFVGIHDDGDPNGLAATVKSTYPEESIVVDLDSGDIECDGDRYETLTGIWNIIPASARSVLESELKTLCRDANIVDGQEPLDSLLDSAFYVDLADAVEGYDVNAESREALDDRAVRDTFLRFFCSVLGGYERFLVVPDADFLISGNEWFDAQGFLASVSTGKAAYLTSLVSTQLFQSFIQRRTEASDVHCMLFDECLVEFHSSPVPYGRLGGDVEAMPSTGSSQPQMLYSLLVDQSAAIPSAYDQSTMVTNRSMDASDADSSISIHLSKHYASVLDMPGKYSESRVNGVGDLITAPSRQDLRAGKKFIYCVDGNPCFPHHLNAGLFLPSEPRSLEIEISNAPDPLLARSERELEEANRRRRMATSYRGSNQRRCLWQLPKLMGSHFLGSWLLCIPALVCQSHLSHDQQSRYLLRALGALRLLRSKQRIVPDEAAYRALMVACGRTRSDRRVELVKLFGLLRSDGIFPSAVTLGQYTKALAEGYSKRLSGNVQDDDYGVEVTESGRRIGRNGVSNRHPIILDIESSLLNLDSSLTALETQGKRWRQRHGSERGISDDNGGDAFADSKAKRTNAKSWLPVVYSSSFLPNVAEATSREANVVKLVAIWSRTRSCTNCSYIPLEEEIQAGWDIVGGENEIPGAVACPRCNSLIVPMLGYREMSVNEAVGINPVQLTTDTFPELFADFSQLPPQMGPTIVTPKTDEGVCYVTYINPSTLRISLEQYVEEYGEDVLERDRLKQLDPEVFYNFWWYCARFSLPLPLPAVANGVNFCAFAAWDRITAERGCFSAAKVLAPLLHPCVESEDEHGLSNDDSVLTECFDDVPLLSRFNLQGFYSTVWDHPDLSKMLVTLVEACDKRDFKLVVESALQSNQRRRVEFGSPNVSCSDFNDGSENSPSSEGCCSPPSVEFDVYRAILYLAKYQCTTAFHAFFPATLKACKGYHFWCAIGTPLPIFDRLLREAIRRLHKSRDQTIVVSIHDVSDVALAFRCVFGHLI